MLPRTVLVNVWLVTAGWDVQPVVAAPVLEEGSCKAAVPFCMQQRFGGIRCTVRE